MITNKTKNLFSRLLAYPDDILILPSKLTEIAEILKAFKAKFFSYIKHKSKKIIVAYEKYALQ